MKRIFVYSGQGSQYFQMGRELYDNDQAFRAAFDHYDALAALYRRRSLVDVIYGDQNPSDPFQRIEDTHFAIPVVQLALTDMLGFKGYLPDAVLGTSLGEYIGLVVSRRLAVDALFEMLARQISLLEAEFGSEDTEQGMLSVIVSDAAQAEDLGIFAKFFAGRVGADTLVFSGSCRDLDVIRDHASHRGLLVQRLAVSYAFHSRLMERIGPAYLAACPDLSRGDPAIEYHSCVCGPPHRYGPERLQAIMRAPFDFDAVSRALIVRDGQQWVDMSPGGIFVRPLREMMEIIGATGTQVIPMMSAFGSDLRRLSEFQLAPHIAWSSPASIRSG